MEIKNKIKKAFFAAIYVALFPLIASAAASPYIVNVVDNFKDAAWYIGDGLIVIGVIIVGVMFLTAAGSDEKLSKAKKALVWVIVGTVIILGFDAFIGVAKGLAGIS